MTNLQFVSLLSTAIGSFVLVILAWLNQNQRLSDFRADVNRKFDKMDTRLDKMDMRLGLIENGQKAFFYRYG